MQPSDTPAQVPPPPTGSGETSPSAKELDELRQLLFGPEQQRLDHLQKRLDNPLIRAEELSNSLPDAITLRAARDDKLAYALEPAIEKTIKASIKKNPQTLADAIFPIIGPGIRKAIVSTIMGMVQSLNQVLNQSFSAKGLKWRWEAFRTRTPFAEVVLLNTLVYRVEQIFLIHRESGIVIQHVESIDRSFQDPDLVSGMLTAIQDFVNDSFTTGADTTLDTLRMGGDQSVWIEQSPHVILATVIRGTPPLTLRNQLRELLTTIHLKYNDAFASFQGDVVPFTVLKNDLEAALQFQVKDSRHKISPLCWVILAIIIAGIGMWGWHTYYAHLKWNRFITQLKAETGLVVTDAGKRNGRYYISGLRDPLARDPAEIIRQASLDPAAITTQWEAYYSLSPDMVLARARMMLKPPPGVSLTLTGTTVNAEGAAPHNWIRDFHHQCLTIPGVTAYNDINLIDKDLEKLVFARRHLEKQTIFFQIAASSIAAGQERQLETLLDAFRELEILQHTLGIPVHTVIVGHTDSTGRESFNRQLSHQRAEFVLQYLIHEGINPSNIKAIGSGKTDRGNPDDPGHENKTHRIVTFKTFIAVSQTGISS